MKTDLTGSYQYTEGRRHAEARFCIALLSELRDLRAVNRVLKEYIRLQDADYMPPTDTQTGEDR